MQDHLFPRVFGQEFQLITRAEGIRLWDADGHEYIDSMSGAISVVSVGHGRREVADAIHAQILRMDYVHDNEFHNEPSIELAARVTAFAGGDFSHAVFFSSGSEAVESAIKLAHNYHVLQGAPGRKVVIGRKRSFHGATMFALGAGDAQHASPCTRTTCRRRSPKSRRPTVIDARSGYATPTARWPARASSSERSSSSAPRTCRRSSPSRSSERPRRR
jgi:Adenosylmethionine-8-amino-7-oxononanoate aminotransferase